MIISMVTKTNKPVTNNNVKKKLGEQLVPFHFKKGEVNNPKGRPKGSRNKFAEAFFNDFLADWVVAGASAIQACRLEDPSTYCRIAASLVPKELSLSNDTKLLDKFLDQLSPEQTLELLNGVRALGAGTKVIR